MSKSRTHSTNYKPRVAMEAISGGTTIQEIAVDLAIDPILVGQQSKQFLQGANELFVRVASHQLEDIPRITSGVAGSD